MDAGVIVVFIIFVIALFGSIGVLIGLKLRKQDLELLQERLDYANRPRTKNVSKTIEDWLVSPPDVLPAEQLHQVIPMGLYWISYFEKRNRMKNSEGRSKWEVYIDTNIHSDHWRAVRDSVISALHGDISDAWVIHCQAFSEKSWSSQQLYTISNWNKTTPSEEDWVMSPSKDLGWKTVPAD